MIDIEETVAMQKLCAVLVLMLAVAGCMRTTEEISAVYASWVGWDIKLFMKENNRLPTSISRDGQKATFIFSSSNSYTTMGVAPSYQTQIIGNTAYTTSYGGVPPMTYNRNCTFIFYTEKNAVERDIIKSWQWQGNAC